MKKTFFAMVALAVWAGLQVGCGGAVSSPPPVADPTIYGTWQVQDDEENGVAHHFLTFTKSRWIQTMVVYDDSGNRLRDQDQSWSGGLIVTDDTVTKQVFGYDSVDKAYTLEGQDGLRMHAWGPQEPVSTFVRWERVHDPIPGGLDGRWQAVGQDNYYTDEGDLLTVVTWQMTISLGERFEFHEQTTFQQGENEDRYDLTMVGEWQVDADEQFIHVDITSAIILSNGNTNTSVAPSLYEGQRLRFGYAAVALPNTLALSTFDSEQVYNLDTQVWEAVTEPSSGEYSRWLERH